MSNAITVRVGRIGGKIESVALNAGATVQDALSAINMTLKETEQVEMGDDTVSLSTPVENDALLLVVKNVAGAR